MNRHVPAPPKPLPLSAPVTHRHAVEFGWERWHAIAHELLPMFPEHWKELALNKNVIPLDPDFDKCYRADIEGTLRIMTARVPSGQLVGYIFLLVGPHPHYKSTKWAHVDMYWLDPVYRQGWTGVRLFKTLIRDAKEMGCANLTLATKTHFMDNRVTKLLQMLGFVPIETIHAMRLV
jgi:GNAT superfamily N-acetyltransferase